MSLNRYARKVDKSQADIVEGLRACGYAVYIIGWPCDLLVHHPRWGVHTRTLECKTLYGKRNPKARVDKRQAQQRAFLELTGCPVVTTLEEALEALK